MTAAVRVPRIVHSTLVRSDPRTVLDLVSTGRGWDCWFTDGSSFEPRVGSPVHLRWKGWTDDGSDITDTGVVRSYEPGSVFALTWRQPPSLVTFTVDEHPEGTWLEVVEAGIPETEAGLARFAECAVGWGEALTLLRCYAEHGIRLST